HLRFHAATKSRDFLRTLVDEQDHDHDLGMVLLDGARDVLQDRRLAGFGRRDDQAALALADGRNQLHGTCREDVGLGLERDAPEGIDARPLLQFAQVITIVRLPGLRVRAVSLTAALGTAARPAAIERPAAVVLSGVAAVVARVAAIVGRITT